MHGQGVNQLSISLSASSHPPIPRSLEFLPTPDTRRFTQSSSHPVIWYTLRYPPNRPDRSIPILSLHGDS